VIHVIAHHLSDASEALRQLSDDLAEGGVTHGHPRQAQPIPRSRDFH